MKKLFIFFLLLGACSFAHAQVSSYDYIKAICDKISQMNRDMTQRFGDTLVVRRIETGVLSQTTSGLGASTQRTLYAGKTYLVYVFTDRRVADLKMNVYSNSNDKWHLTQTVDKNENKNKSADNMYGDYELYALKPDTSMEYLVEISAPAGNAAAARYGMIIWSKELNDEDGSNNNNNNSGSSNPGSTRSNQGTSGNGNNGSTGNAAGSTYYSTSKKSTCFWDAQQKTFNRCQDEEFSSLFVLNPGKSVFKHTTDKMTSSYFVQSTEYDSKNKLTSYSVVSDAGNKYTLMVSDDNSRVTFFADKGDDSYIVKYTIRKNWTD